MSASTGPANGSIEVPGLGVQLVGVPEGWELHGGWDVFRQGHNFLGTQSTWWPAGSKALDTSNAFTICIARLDQLLCDPGEDPVAAHGELDGGYEFVVAV